MLNHDLIGDTYKEAAVDCRFGFHLMFELVP